MNSTPVKLGPSKVGPYTYPYVFRPLKLTPEQLASLESGDDDGTIEVLFGFLDRMNQRIVIHDNFPDQVQRSTLLHENVHGMCEFGGIRLPEKVVEAFSNILFMWMVDNKDAVRYVIGDVRRK